ncbi:hypothetical protein [Streptomyces gobiensis]|uniref:hypothetical protein n=1 Tax=Streptomyces gobiensis TaxID=2875706 RepID=UPI001E40EEF5|nr:hypothetical protein [Streptomyces gobiensis]UGY92375.1 hypothetical protein test1122_11995 [Streptomyces gobiensis]
MPKQRVTLAYDNFPSIPDEELAERFAPLAADPPHGLTYEVRYGVPVLTGWVEAESKFAAIAEVAAQVKARYGIVFNDGGIEKPDEWLGDEHAQQVTAHLVLSAIHRAKHCGVSTGDLMRLITALE